MVQNASCCNENQMKPALIFCKYDALVDPKSLREHAKNRNKHPKGQVTRLAKLLKYYGFRHPIIVDADDKKTIIVGRGRQMSAIEADFELVPVVYQSFESEDQKYSFIQADNAISEWSQLDLSSINMDIGELGPDFDIELLGLKDFTIDVADKYDDDDKDQTPGTPSEPITKPGDIYQLGNHRLMCGDAMDILAVDKLMDGHKADLVFTDPPYGYQYESNHQTKHKMLQNDDKILDFIPSAFVATNENAAMFVCGSHQTIEKWKPLVEAAFKYKNLIVWKKNNWSMGDLKGAFAGQHELIIYAVKGTVHLVGERSRDVWEFKRDPPEHHPTQKPVELVEFAITKTTQPENRVVDFFGGSGSTLIACETTGRKCYTMEIEPGYCDVIVRRWEKLTDQKAILLNGATES